MTYPSKPNTPTMLRPAAVAVGLLMLLGCQTYHDYSAFVSEPRPIVTANTYRMEPPDSVYITSRRVREINGQQQQIRPDGKITLPLLGTFYVAGRTPEEVSAELEKMARDYYDDADVTVRVVGFNSKKIYVFGEVGVSGPYAYNGANTVLDTLARAQPTRFADPAKILVLRPNPDGELIRRMTVDLNKMIREGDTTLDAVLEEDDIIFVPANPLAAIGIGIQQVLLPITPAASTFQGPSQISGNLSSEPYSNNGNTTNTNNN